MSAGGQKTNLSFIIAVASIAIAAASFWHNLSNDDLKRQIDLDHRLTVLETRSDENHDRIERMSEWLRKDK